MKKIKISRVYTEKTYGLDKHIWDKNDDAQPEILPLAADQKVELCKFLLRKSDDDFAQSLLSELAEDDGIPLDVIKEIFRKGDVGCKVSVCLRDNLDDELQYMCAECSEEEVAAHYRNKQLNLEL